MTRIESTRRISPSMQTRTCWHRDAESALFPGVLRRRFIARHHTIVHVCVRRRAQTLVVQTGQPRGLAPILVESAQRLELRRQIGPLDSRRGADEHLKAA